MYTNFVCVYKCLHVEFILFHPSMKTLLCRNIHVWFINKFFPQNQSSPHDVICVFFYCLCLKMMAAYNIRVMYLPFLMLFECILSPKLSLSKFQWVLICTQFQNKDAHAPKLAWHSQCYTYGYAQDQATYLPSSGTGSPILAKCQFGDVSISLLKLGKSQCLF